MISDRSKFDDIGPYKGTCIKFSNDVPCLVKAKGSIQLTNKINYENVYWVERLNYNQLSVSQFNKLGYNVEFHHRKAKIFDGDGKPIRSGDQTKGNLFYLDLPDETCVFAQHEDIWL